jgi:hypothetical protein
MQIADLNNPAEKKKLIWAGALGWGNSVSLVDFLRFE